MKINVKEVGWFGLVNMWAWAILLQVIMWWDTICGVQINHHVGYGWMQILAMAATGLMVFWSWTMKDKWDSYAKKIHELK